MVAIFDLDMTVVNSSVAEPLMKARKWSDVYKLVSEIRPYQGIAELLHELLNRCIHTAIVTSAPRPYCEKVIKHWNIVTDVTVCYHDTVLHKPNPEPIFKSLELLRFNGGKAVSIGDMSSDVIAAKKAGVISVGVLWGAENKEILFESNPDYIFATVPELRTFLYDYFRV